MTPRQQKQFELVYSLGFLAAQKWNEGEKEIPLEDWHLESRARVIEQVKREMMLEETVVNRVN